MRIYMDEQVPRSITQGLRLRGVEVLTVQEDGLSGFEDPVILDRATTIGYLVYTQDDDFRAEAARRAALGIPVAGVIYCHQLRLSIGERVKQLHRIAVCSDSEENANRVEILPL
jgi:predicted nuclease of predicted toxin-antitoxin system